MRLLVCGSRDWTDSDYVFLTLDQIHAKIGITCIIEGEQRGVDVMAREWAEHRGIAFDPYEAEWIKLGRSAGPIRNKRMIVEGRPDCYFAFPGGIGTENMKKQAKRAKIPRITLAVQSDFEVNDV